MKVLNI